MSAKKVSATKEHATKRPATKRPVKNPSPPPKHVADKDLYLEVKERVRNLVDVWPSAYASLQLAQEYQRAGGRYYTPDGRVVDYNPRNPRNSASKTRKARTTPKRQSNGIVRWLEENWVNVCETPNADGVYPPCGRPASALDPESYPYCRPSVRVSSQTPKTVGEMTPKEISRMCRMKRSIPPGVRGRPTRVFVDDA